MKTIIPEAALAQHTAILGKTGSGKTSTAKLAIEQVFAEGARVCVLDPIKSDWWGLTSSADGKKPGLAFDILGGPRGHVALHSSAGKAIGELVATGALPHSIIDMADFEPGGQARFFVDFAPTLLRRMRGVLYLVIEEAHLFAPKERSGIGAEAMAIHWAKTLATAGRSKGIRLMLLSQRTQALHNALLGSCDTLIAHRFTAPADQEPVNKWLKANVTADIAREVAESLSSLKTGEAWLCAGEAKIFGRRQFPRIHTFDNTATPTGDGDVQEVKQAPVDQEKLRAIIGDAVKEAEENDPKRLRAKITTQEAELARLRKSASPPAAVVDQVAVASARQEGREEGTREGYLAGLKAIEPIAERVGTLAIGIAETIEGYQADLKRLAKTPPPVQRAAAPAPRPSAPARQSRTPADSGQALPVGERAVLTAAAQYPEGVERDQLSVLTGYKKSSRDAYIARLRDKGFVQLNGDRIEPTEPGFAALGSDFEPLPVGDALRDYWIRKLPEGERKVFEVLISFHPKAIERTVIDERTGYKKSSRDAYLGRLRARRLVEFTGRGEVKASDGLFG